MDLKFDVLVEMDFFFFDKYHHNNYNSLLHEYDLNDHLKYSCKSSIEIVRNLKNNVKKVNGEFTSVWHNESLSNLDRWKGWREVFESTWLD